MRKHIVKLQCYALGASYASGIAGVPKARGSQSYCLRHSPHAVRAQNRRHYRPGFGYAYGMNNPSMNGLNTGGLNMGSLNMTSIVVSTIAYFVAAYYIKRYLVEMGIPKGTTRGMVVFIGAAVVSYGVAYLVGLVT
jgi:hypothetical protein